MSPIDVIVGLFVVAIPLVVLAWRMKIPYPVVLVIGGALLGFVPHLPVVPIDPKLVFLVLLPPLLYWEATTAPSLSFRRNRGWIGTLTVGLTIATILVIAAIAHTILGGVMPWAVAFVLAATVAPTDEAASLPILERLHVPRRVIAIIEGEALLNDAGSLIFYAAAIGVVTSGTFSLWQSALDLVVGVVGGLAIGAAVGWVALRAWRAMSDPQLEAIVDIAVPYLAYIAADLVHASGILAVVVAGLLVNRRSVDVVQPSMRLRTTGFWSTLIFAVNALLYILVGTQLHAVLAAVGKYPWTTLVLLAVAVNAGLIAVRLVWIFAQGWFSGMRDWKSLLLIAWSGLRGGISLAAALAIPATIASHHAFPERELIVFVAFSSVLGTLVLGGFTLPPAIGLMRLRPDTSQADESQRAIAATARAALARLEELCRRGEVPERVAQVLRGRYELRLETYTPPGGDGRGRADHLSEIEGQLVDVQRATLIQMRNRGEIDDDVVRQVQLQLDKDETRSTQFRESMIPGSE